jgi:pimeloyl-ACP methyl ester carboxylesterase
LKTPDAIVLLPGITGSELVKNGKLEGGRVTGGEVVWGWSGGALLGNILSSGRKVVSDLWGDPSKPTADAPDDVLPSRLLPDLHVLPGFWKIDGYGAVSDFLVRELELTEGENFFPFPYDWRRDNRLSARLLKAGTEVWLRAWRERSGNNNAKLILVGHSMGGLVARYFLEVLEGWRDTRALITFGTPYRGSLNAVDALANGLNPLGRIDLTAFAQRLTSLHQLLPIYPCIDPGDGNLVRVTETSVPNLDLAKARDALAFHREISDAVKAHRDDAAYRENGYRIYPIVGVQQPTNQSARIAASRVELLQYYRKGDDRPGDGTVPRVSAMPQEQADAAAGMFAATKHSSLQNADAVLPHLAGVIESLQLDLGVYRGPKGPAPVQFTLQLDDLHRLGEAVRITARPSAAIGDAEVTIEALGAGAEGAHLPMQRTVDGSFAAEFRPAQAGAFRATVSASGGAEAATDVFEVVATA